MKKILFAVLIFMLCYGLISLVTGLATGDMGLILWVSEHKFLMAIAGCWILTKLVRLKR